MLVQHHQGEVTVARLLAQLLAIGIDLSKRQVIRLLIAGQDGFINGARNVLRAGLTNAAWLSVDDTGARHRAANGVCTQIGNDHFAWFGTTGSKSRLNFLDLLRPGHTDYVINAEALEYMRGRALAGPVVTQLAQSPHRLKNGQAHLVAQILRMLLAKLVVRRPARQSERPVLLRGDGLQTMPRAGQG